MVSPTKIMPQATPSKNIMGEKGMKERGIMEESCVKKNRRHSPVGGGIPMLCGMSVMVGGLYIAAVCL